MSNQENQITGIKINITNKAQFLQKLSQDLSKTQLKSIYTINPEFIVHSTKDSYFKEILNKNDYNTIDGSGVIWALYYLKHKPKSIFFSIIYAFYTLSLLILNPKKIYQKKDIITGADFIYDICNMCAKSGKKIYFLGSTKKSNTKTKENIKKLYPNIKIVGKYIDIQIKNDGGLIKYDKNTNQKIIDDINTNQADVVFVAFGYPKQEKWIYENKNQLKTVKLIMGVGGSFDYISGKTKRPPAFISKRLHLEWLWRLIMEPKRYYRIYNAFFNYVYKVITIKN